MVVEAAYRLRREALEGPLPRLATVPGGTPWAILAPIGASGDEASRMLGKMPVRRDDWEQTKRLSSAWVACMEDCNASHSGYGLHGASQAFRWWPALLRQSQRRMTRSAHSNSASPVRRSPVDASPAFHVSEFQSFYRLEQGT